MTDTKWARTVGKVAPVDLIKTGLPQTFSLLKKKKKWYLQRAIKKDMLVLYIEFYYEGLVYTIMEAKRSRDLWSIWAGGPGKSVVHFCFKPKGLRARGTKDLSPRWVLRSENQEHVCLRAEGDYFSASREGIFSSSAFLFCSEQKRVIFFT